MRCALPALAALALLCASAAAAPPAPAADGAAEIELRKSFRPAPRGGARSGPSRGGAAAQPAAAALPDPSAPVPPAPGSSTRAAGVALALGEALQDSGELHLPGVGGSGLVLDGALVPVLAFGNGRRALLDVGGRIGAGAASDIARLWPGFALVQARDGADLRALIGAVLDASGYAAVTRGGSVVLGREITVRLNPDFVIVKDDRDLLDGETRAVSVVEPSAAIPPELRELAAGRRVRTVELSADGSAVGSDRAPWVDPTGRVTTIQTARPAAVLEELAAALDLPQPAAVAPTAADELPAAVGALLGSAGVPAIGPTVEFYPESPAGARPRFVIAVPGWLAEAGGRRVLITGAEPPELLRRYLCREGVDVFEYRLR